MMASSVWILVIWVVAICALMGRRLYGKSLQELFDESDREHHRVQAVIARHPHGGTWHQFSRWLAESV